MLCAQNTDCFQADRSIWDNPWLSCESRPNPKQDYGESHWIMYDFSEIRNLSKTRIWNINDPNILDQGFKNVQIDYSVDGANWTYWGSFSFEKGTGEAIYSGFEGPDLNGISAQFILITLIDSYGTNSCAGFTEIKFYLLPGYEEGVNTSTADIKVTQSKALYVAYPNPANNTCYISGDLSQEKTFKLFDTMGKLLKSGKLGPNQNQINLSTLTPGFYIIEIDADRIQLVKS